MIASVDELFAQIPAQFDPAQWGTNDAVLQFNITGEGGGNWIATITGDTLAVTQGTATEPSMTMTCATQDMLAIVNGELSAVSAFMQGRVKIEGDMALAMKLQNLLSK